jgi:hypothetical protein
MVSPDFERLLAHTLQSLEGKLKLACEKMRDNSREGATTALEGVIEFINSIPRLEAQTLALPLVGRMAQLRDLDQGRVGTMLSAAVGFDNRHPDASFRKVIKAYAIFSINQLHDHGMKIDKCCKFVAINLEQSGVPIGARASTPSWRTVKNWRYDVKKHDSEGQLRHTLEALDAECKSEGMTLAEVKKRLARLLPMILPPTQAIL